MTSSNKETIYREFGMTKLSKFFEGEGGRFAIIIVGSILGFVLGFGFAFLISSVNSLFFLLIPLALFLFTYFLDRKKRGNQE